MTQPDELKQCPFKAANDPEKHDLVHELFDDLVFTKTINGHAWVPKEQIRIRCTSCFTLGPPAETHSEANKLWNTRTPDLSRILKLAALSGKLIPEMKQRLNCLPTVVLSPFGKQFVAAYGQLTDEDHQLLEAVLKE